MQPVYGERALRWGKTLILADLHIGIESELKKFGVFVPNQYEKIRSRIISLIESTKAKRIILLGDVKHNIPSSTIEEYKNIPKLLDELSGLVEVLIIKGNHDGNLEKLVQKYEVLKEFREGKVLFTHGHRKIDLCDEIDTYVIGHFHPCVEFIDKNGIKIKEAAWIRGEFKNKSKFIILPAFNDLIEGISFKKIELRYVEKKSVKTYLLDGTYLKI